MFVYNTLTRRLDEFRPINQPNVKMYSCGPTVYDYAHIGHFRSYTFVDTLKKVLTYNNFRVKHVMNLTDVGHLTEYDVEEQMKRRGKVKGSVWDIAKFYAEDFFKAMKKLNISTPSVVCKASDHIKEQIELIKSLERRGYTYKIDDGIYFDIRKFPEYGKLGRLKLDGQEPGARVDINPQKKTPYDFVLWKFTRPEEKRAMEWNSFWGRGVPGWHIECSAMSMKYLGESFDIHTGGEDLIPIHHTNEIAQSEAATGKKFVNYWIHNAHLFVEGERMSRSKGNFYTMKDVEERGFDPLALRYLFLTAHYRSKMNFTWEGLKGAQIAYRKLQQMVTEWKKSKQRIPPIETGKTADSYKKEFKEKINNDLNTPEALSVVWQTVKSSLPPSQKLDLILYYDQIMGLQLAQKGKPKMKISKTVKILVKKREDLRKQKKWVESDKIRKQIKELGWAVKDTPGGPKLTRN